MLASDTPMNWMVNEARTAGLLIENHLINSLTDGVNACLQKSRTTISRHKAPLHRDQVVKDKPTTIHPSVKERYLSDNKYRPVKLKELVEKVGWEGIVFGE